VDGAAFAADSFTTASSRSRNSVNVRSRFETTRGPPYVSTDVRVQSAVDQTSDRHQGALSLVAPLPYFLPSARTLCDPERFKRHVLAPEAIEPNLAARPLLCGPKHLKGRRHVMVVNSAAAASQRTFDTATHTLRLHSAASVTCAQFRGHRASDSASPCLATPLRNNPNVADRSALP
jgi:hypothetical protein